MYVIDDGVCRTKVQELIPQNFLVIAILDNNQFLLSKKK